MTNQLPVSGHPWGQDGPRLAGARRALLHCSVDSLLGDMAWEAALTEIRKRRTAGTIDGYCLLFLDESDLLEPAVQTGNTASRIRFEPVFDTEDFRRRILEEPIRNPSTDVAENIAVCLDHLDAMLVAMGVRQSTRQKT